MKTQNPTKRIEVDRPFFNKQSAVYKSLLLQDQTHEPKDSAMTVEAVVNGAMHESIAHGPVHALNGKMDQQKRSAGSVCFKLATPSMALDVQHRLSTTSRYDERISMLVFCSSRKHSNTVLVPDKSGHHCASCLSRTNGVVGTPTKTSWHD